LPRQKQGGDLTVVLLKRLKGIEGVAPRKDGRHPTRRKEVCGTEGSTEKLQAAQCGRGEVKTNVEGPDRNSGGRIGRTRGQTCQDLVDARKVKDWSHKFPGSAKDVCAKWRLPGDRCKMEDQSPGGGDKKKKKSSGGRR